MNNNTATRDEQLAALKVLEATMFEAQDAWEAAKEANGCARANEEHNTYKVACNAYRAARSAWINS